MRSIEIKKGVYWVGAIDWNVRDFHGYLTSRGTSYNAYLIIDEKITLVDGVKKEYTDELLSRVKNIIDPSKIDYIVCNHVEMDHTGAIPKLMELAPNAELITSKAGEKGLMQHYQTDKWKFKQVLSGEEISIGDRTLKFIHTPMVHWPDSMATFLIEDKILMPNDAFGQHMASPNLFDSDNSLGIIMEEASKYYANIVYPFGRQVLKTIDALKDLDIDMIAPSHGVIWKDNVKAILEKYKYWGEGQNNGSALIVYDTMWGSTEKMANAIRSGFERLNIPVTMRNTKSTHISDIVNDILESKYVAIGSPSLNNTVLPTIGGLITYLKGLKPSNKIGIPFGSYGWNKNGLKDIEEVMNLMKWKIADQFILSNFIPSEELLTQIETVTKELVSSYE